MSDLRRLFDEIAGQAKQYDVAGPAIAAARRRQRWSRPGPIVAAIAVIVAVAALWIPLHSTGSGTPKMVGVPEMDAAGPAVDSTVSWLPREFTVPTAAPSLPVDRAVGPGAAVYYSCDADQWCTGLLTSDGKTYSLPARSEARLSPDGRWLVYGSETASVLRDLTGAAVHPLSGLVPLAWSPDSRWLVLEPPPVGDGTNTSRVTVVDVQSGQRHEVAVHDPDEWSVVAVFPSGDLLLNPRSDGGPDEGPWAPSSGSSGSPKAPVSGGDRHEGLGMRIADGRTGEQRRFRVSLDGALDAGEQVEVGPAMSVAISRDGGAVLLRTFRSEDAMGGAVLRVDARTGEVLWRYRLPAAEERELIGWLDDGILLKREHRYELLDPNTGQRRVIGQQPADARKLSLRGARY